MGPGGGGFWVRTCGNAAGWTLRSTGDTPCDLDIYYRKALKREHQRCGDNPCRKVTLMLPEATIPKPRAAQASPSPWVMTPLFGLPAGSDCDVARSRPSRRRTAAGSRRASSRATSRLPGGRAARGLVAVKPGPVIDVAVKSVPSKDTVALLAVTAERMRHALSRRFLR